MNLYSKPDTGKIVYRWKGLVKHTGVMAGTDDYGRSMVIHNHPYSGKATVVTFAEFANGNQVFYSNEECSFTPYNVWQRAIDAVNHNTPYDWLNSNCQHLTSDACHGKPESSDLNFFMSLALIFGGALFVTSLLRDK